MNSFKRLQNISKFIPPKMIFRNNFFKRIKECELSDALKSDK